MITRTLFLFLFILTIGQGQAQSDTAKFNSAFISLGGVALFYSVNYERIIRLANNTGISIGAGFSTHLGWREGLAPRLPVHLKFYPSMKKHTIEIGAATCPYAYFDKLLPFKENVKGFQFAHFVQLAYKYSFAQQRFSIGAAYTPLIMDNGRPQFYSWAALRFGVNF